MEEYTLSINSFNKALNFLEFSEDIMMNILKLATVCSEWENLFKVLRNNEEKFLNRVYNIQTINSFINIYKSIYYKSDINIEEVINNCETNKEKSVFIYLISLLIDKNDKNLIKEYCKISLDLWSNNLAAAEYLFKNNEIVNIDLITKLISLNKIDNSMITNQDTNKKELDFEFLPLGGGDEIGASSYYLRIKDFNIVIDAGIKINSNNIEYPNYSLLEELNLIDKIEYLIITHAHLDHCGAILDLWSRNKTLKTIMTRETKELLKLNLKSKGLSQNEEYELEQLISKSILLKFNEKIRIKEKNVSIELYRAGHILGAASIMIRSNECNVFVTGDFCLRDQNTVQGLELPIKEKIDILITESTYGNKQSENSHLHEYIVMQEYIKNSIKSGKRILIPSFAIGRAQEVLALINNIDTDSKIRVYIDGSAISTTKLYEKFSKEILVKKRNYYVNDEFYLSKHDFINQEVLTNKCCVVSSSGMLLEGSASSEYSKLMLNDENSVCILTGYQAFNTVGARLKEQMNFSGERYIVIEGKQYNIKAELRSFNLSAHSNINEILAVQLYLKAKNVILMHGNYNGKSTLLENRLKSLTNANIYQSINNKKIKL